MTGNAFEKGQIVRLTKSYVDESFSFRTGARGRVVGRDGKLFLIRIPPGKRTICVRPEMLEPIVKM